MKTLLPVLLFAFVITSTRAAETHFQSGPRQTALIELYTSEGCSSCPPAEAWLSRLKDSPGLWKQFVPIAFHVDYWDHLGWRDRFASREWTQRQGRYAALWRNESVYTPGFVLNGREWRTWSGTAPSPNENKTGILRVTSSNGEHWSIEFEPAKKETVDCDAHIALLGSRISSKVGGGENSGRNLEHDFVVLAHASNAMQSEAGHLATFLIVKGPHENVPQKSVAVWITKRDQIEPLQATGGWLP
jgi:hypothetical protein